MDCLSVENVLLALLSMTSNISWSTEYLYNHLIFGLTCSSTNSTQMNHGCLPVDLKMVIDLFTFGHKQMVSQNGMPREICNKNGI